MKYVSEWVDAVRASGLKPMSAAAATARRHLGGILNYRGHRRTNAMSEGFHAMVRSREHRVKGLPDYEAFRTSMLFVPGQLGMRLS
jgi:transposase